MSERIVLHIGTHKTGSTSLQQLLHDHPALLSAVGASYPKGLVIPGSHAELPLLAIRPERTWPARLRLPETTDERWLAAAARHVEEVLDVTSSEVLVLSHEDLSYVRHDDEIERLRRLLGDRPARVVVYLRAPGPFLRSYRAQLEAMGFRASADPSSFAHVEPDSWLVDHRALVDVYRRGFGEVEVLDYDHAVETDGSVVPAFTDLLGIARSSLPPLDQYFLNRSNQQLRPDDAQLAVIRRRLAEQAVNR